MEHETSPGSDRWLQTTRILDFDAPAIQTLMETRGWRRLPTQEAAARAAYEFCRDEILFGYNAEADDMPASAVLAEGLGHCNTKTNLLMALLRGLGIACRVHAFTIHKQLQRGAMTPLVYRLAPDEISHTWAEARLGERWLALEGLILDQRYLQSVQRAFGQCAHTFVGYGVATPDLQHPPIEWTGGDTFIQREGIARDFGVFDAPDDFYAVHGTNLRGIKGWLYRRWFHQRLNANLERIRREGPSAGDGGLCRH